MHGEPVVIEDFGLRIVLMEKVFINSKSEIRNRQSAIKGPSVKQDVLPLQGHCLNRGHATNRLAAMDSG